MTNEQWIIYFYEVYPNGLLMIAFIITTTLLIIISLRSYFDYQDDLGNASKTNAITQEYKNKTLLFQVLKIPTRIIGIITIILIVFMSLLPSKDVFLALMTTPTIIKSSQKEGDKLNRIDSIINKVLEKPEKVLKDKNQ